MKQIALLALIALALSCKKEDPPKPTEYTVTLHADTKYGKGFKMINFVGEDTLSKPTFSAHPAYGQKVWDTTLVLKTGARFKFYACTERDGRDAETTTRAKIGDDINLMKSSYHAGTWDDCSITMDIVIP